MIVIICQFLHNALLITIHGRIMTIARKNIVDNEVPGFYNCLNRCVRRAFLCGIDELTSKDYSHRKDWMENRIIELSGIFAIEVFTLAVMSNHYLCEAPHNTIISCST